MYIELIAVILTLVNILTDFFIILLFLFNGFINNILSYMPVYIILYIMKINKQLKVHSFNLPICARKYILSDFIIRRTLLNHQIVRQKIKIPVLSSWYMYIARTKIQNDLLSGNLPFYLTPI